MGIIEMSHCAQIHLSQKYSHFLKDYLPLSVYSEELTNQRQDYYPFQVLVLRATWLACIWKLDFQDHNSLIRMAPCAKANHTTHMVYAKHLFFFW